MPSLAGVAVLSVPLEVITGVAGLLFGAVGMRASAATARERRQPIVVAHEDKSRSFSGQGASWFVLAHIRNESGPAAFNVRFGVEYGGIRFPYKMNVDDPDEGNVQRVVPAGARLPANEAENFPVLLTSEDIWHTAAVRGSLDDTAIYWCRYENALGHTWETRNPADRSAKLDIRRVRRPGRAAEGESKARAAMRSEGREWEAQALEELRTVSPRTDLD